MKFTDGSVEQVAFGEVKHSGQGRETDSVNAEAERGYEPSKLKLSGFVTLGIKMAIAEFTTLCNELFAKVVIEAQKLALPPVTKTVRKVELAEVVRLL